MYNIKIDIKAHNEIHAIEEDCSIMDELKAYVTIRKQSDIRKRNADKQSAKQITSEEKA